MSLYDDFDVVKQKSDGWSSGMKLFQSQMQLKKAAQTQVCILMGSGTKPYFKVRL